MSVKRLSNIKIQYDDGNGALASNYRLFFYAAGSSTKQNTYNSSTGSVANSNPIVLNALGEPAVEIWLTEGLSYKLGIAIPGTDDPPASFVWTEDNISGVNDTATSVDEWKASLLTPTFVSTTSFTLSGDQTTVFHVGRRLKTTNTAGTVYSTISASAFGASTTVTVVNDSGALDSGLSAVSYGLQSATNPSDPLLTDAFPVRSGSADKTKKLAFEIDGFTTATTRTITVPDASTTLVGTDVAQTLTNKTLTSPTINTPTISTPTITSPTINTGVSQGGGVKHQRFGATNATAAAAAATADTTYSWTTPFANANYTPVVIGLGQAATSIAVLSITSFDSNGVTVRVTAGNGVAASFTAVHIIAFHD